MKAKILSIVLLLSLSSVLMAQTTEKGPKKGNRGAQNEMRMNGNGGERGMQNGMNLTDAQKDAFKQSMMDLHKKIQPLRNELGEAEAHQKTLVTAEKTDMGAINKNIEKIGGIRVEIAKLETKHHLDMRAQLTDEQKLKFDMMKGMMKNQGPKGMNRNRQMQREHAMN